jgi:hypothetical protein
VSSRVTVLLANLTHQAAYKVAAAAAAAAAAVSENGLCPLLLLLLSVAAVPHPAPKMVQTVAAADADMRQ